MSRIDRFRLDGKVAIITGASAGLGVAFAAGIAAAGAAVTICARRTQRLTETRTLIEAGGGQCRAAGADVTQPEDCERVGKQTLDGFSKVDILINNAGFGTSVPAARQTPEEFRWVIDVNPARHVLDGSSVWASYGAGKQHRQHRQRPGLHQRWTQAASFSKAAIIGLTRDLAQQRTGRRGIRVNALAAGFFPSEMTAGYSERYLDSVRARVPRRPDRRPRRAGGGWDLLANDAASYISGVLLPVDGGLLTK
jgi:NAD(P)-dependent dehydrogenase (short-subunit alcohol dehydrogenase family)